MLAEFATGVMREDVKREVVTHHVFTFHGFGRPDQIGLKIFNCRTQMTQCLRSEIRGLRSDDDCSDLGLQTSDLGQG